MHRGYLSSKKNCLVVGILKIKCDRLHVEEVCKGHIMVNFVMRLVFVLNAMES